MKVTFFSSFSHFIFSCDIFKSLEVRTSKLAKQMEVLDTKPKDLSLIPRSHMMEGES